MSVEIRMKITIQLIIVLSSGRFYSFNAINANIVVYFIIIFFIRIFGFVWALEILDLKAR